MISSKFSSYFSTKTYSASELFNISPRPLNLINQFKKLAKVQTINGGNNLSFEEILRILGIVIPTETEAPQTYIITKALLKEQGLTVIPVGNPIAPKLEQTIVLTPTPDIMSDPDIVEAKRSNTTGSSTAAKQYRLNIALQKINNYTLLMHIFEGLFAVVGKDGLINNNQKDILVELLDNLILPAEGAYYLRQCLTYSISHPLPINALYTAHSQLTPPQDENTRKNIVIILAKLALNGYSFPNIGYHPLAKDIKYQNTIFKEQYLKKIKKEKIDFSKTENEREKKINTDDFSIDALNQIDRINIFAGVIKKELENLANNEIKNFYKINSPLKLSNPANKSYLDAFTKRLQTQLLLLLHKIDIFNPEKITYFTGHNILIINDIMCENANLYGINPKAHLIHQVFPYIFPVKNRNLHVSHVELKYLADYSSIQLKTTLANTIKQNHCDFRITVEELWIIIRSLTHRLFVEDAFSKLESKERQTAYIWLMHWYKQLYHLSTATFDKDRALLKFTSRVISLYALIYPNDISTQDMDIINNHPFFEVYHEIAFHKIIWSAELSPKNLDEIKNYFYQTVILPFALKTYKLSYGDKLDFELKLLRKAVDAPLEKAAKLLFDVCSENKDPEARLKFLASQFGLSEENKNSLEKAFMPANRECLDCILNVIYNMLFGYTITYPFTNFIEIFKIDQIINFDVSIALSYSHHSPENITDTLVYRIIETKLFNKHTTNIEEIRTMLLNHTFSNNHLRELFKFSLTNRNKCSELYTYLANILDLEVIPSAKLEGGILSPHAYNHFAFVDHKYHQNIASQIFIVIARILLQSTLSPQAIAHFYKKFKEELCSYLEKYPTKDFGCILTAKGSVRKLTPEEYATTIPSNEELKELAKKPHPLKKGASITETLKPSDAKAYVTCIDYIKDIIALNKTVPPYNTYASKILPLEIPESIRQFIITLGNEIVSLAKDFYTYDHVRIIYINFGIHINNLAIFSGERFTHKSTADTHKNFKPNQTLNAPKSLIPKDLTLNMSKVKDTIEETKEVHSLLNPIFTANEQTNDDIVLELDKKANEVVVGTLDIDKEAPSDLSDIYQANGKVSLDAIFNALPLKCQTIIKQLMQLQDFTKKDFERICKQSGMMPDGALEIINNWSYAQFDVPIIEYDDPMFFDKELLMEI